MFPVPAESNSPNRRHRWPNSRPSVLRSGTAGCQECVPSSSSLGRYSFLLITDAKAAPISAVGGDVAGVRHANSDSSTDKLTREHRMTLDEAHLILNTKPESTLESVKNVCIPFHPYPFLGFLLPRAGLTLTPIALRAPLQNELPGTESESERGCSQA